MELALYHPTLGYYARAARRSGRTGDFFTSVDVGRTFGDLLERQIAEMADRLPGPFDLVEAGAGSARLAADILESMRERHPALYERTRLHLVESSASARSMQGEVLGEHRIRLVSSSDVLPDRFAGVLVANELLDAMPVHHVVMRDRGLREVYVDAIATRDGGTSLRVHEGPPSSPELGRYLEAAGATLEPGWRTEIGLQARDWILSAGRRLECGFFLLIDYGHEAKDLYSASHAGGTLTAYRRHGMAGPDVAAAAAPPWLEAPGEQDLTAHVDFTTIRRAGEAAGLETLCVLDQTYFLLGLADAETLDQPASSIDQVKRRLALKTLLMPGGLGSTMKVLVMGRNVGRPALRGCAAGGRFT